MERQVVAGRYRLDARIGIGGMAEVWAAHDLRLDRPVALKLLASDADPVRFEREARAVAGLSHLHICQLYDFGEADGRPYISFELLDGGTLEDRLAPGAPLPDTESAGIARDLAAALAHAHALGVLHRDVKPANVFFDRDGTIKLGDFGIAQLADASTITEAGTVLGTAAYLSPEQVQGEPVTAATDVYGYGIVLFRMLTGRLPYEADDPLELAALHVNAEPPAIASLRPDAPADLSRLAESALAKRPEDRPPDGAALLAELSPAAAIDDDTQVIPVRQRRITPRRIAAAAALAALALAGTAFAILATPESSKAPVTGSEPRTQSSRGDTGATGTTQPAPPATTRATTREETTRPTTTARTTAPETTPTAPTRTATTSPATTADTTTTEPETTATTEPETTGTETTATTTETTVTAETATTAETTTATTPAPGE